MDDAYYDLNNASELPPEEAPQSPMFTEKSDIALLDRALLPAALSASAYSTSCWAFDVAAGVCDPVGWLGEESFAQDRDALSRAMMIASCCSPLSAQELGVDPSASGASFERGVWRKGGLAAAICCVSVREDGTRELQLSIRGTDMQNHPNALLGAFRGLVGYFLWTYPRIEKHASAFEPLARAIADYAADPANGIDCVVVSGHSLGAAAAETLLPALASKGARVEMFGFGSPGTGSGWVTPLLALGRAASSAGGAARSGASKALGWAANLAGPQPIGGLLAFSHLARKAAGKIAPGIRAEARSSAAEGARVTQFRHPNDPVPKTGSLLYSSAGQIRDALFPMEHEDREQGRQIALKGIGAHSSVRYARSIEHMLERASEDLAPSGCAPEALRLITHARLEAAKLEASIPAERVADAIKTARESNAKRLASLNPLDPAIARILGASEPKALADRVKSMRAVRKFAAALAASERLGAPYPMDKSTSLFRGGAKPAA